MTKKSTNFELLRIILTLFIPVYHWLLYNGIFYADNAPNNLYAMIPFAGIPFSCLYAFVAMSGYFLLKKKYSWNVKKIYSFLALTVSLWIFKTIFVNALFPGWKMNYFVDSFFLKGAWWYVYPYILLMIFYPLLNRFIYTITFKKLFITTSVLGLLYVISGITNKTVFLNDCIMFSFIYFLMGCMQQMEKTSAFYLKYKKTILISVYAISVIVITVSSLYLKYPDNGIALEIENDILQRLHTRYNLLGLISGIALFELVKDMEIPYIPAIHRFSKITLFIFLLHETVMSVFWAFEIKSCEYLSYLPTWEFFGLILIYMLLCILVAAFMYKVYYSIIEPVLWNKLINKICETNFSKGLENIYK